MQGVSLTCRPTHQPPVATPRESHSRMIKQLKEKRNSLLLEMQNIATHKDGWNSERRSKFDELNTQAAQLDSDIARHEAIEARTAETQRFERSARPAVSGARHLSGDKAERKAQFSQAFRSYAQGNMTQEQRDLLTTSDSTGGAVINQEFSDVLTDSLKYYGPVANYVNFKVTDNGRPMKHALVNDTANSFKLLATEGTSAPVETDPAFASRILNYDTVSTGLVKVSMEELQDSNFDIDNLLRTHFAKRYGRGLEAAITLGVDGAGTTLPNSVTGGLASLAVVGTTTAAYANGIGWDDLTATYSSVDPAYSNPNSAAWFMNSNTRGYLIGLKDGFGRPYFTPDPSADGPFERLLGFRVVLDQAMPNIAVTAAPILFGDASSAMKVNQTEFSVLRLNERYADTLEVGFIGWLRVGSISLIASGAPSPLSSLKIASS